MINSSDVFLIKGFTVYYSYTIYTIYVNINMHKSGYLSSNILESVVFNVKVEIISVYITYLRERGEYEEKIRYNNIKYLLLII